MVRIHDGSPISKFSKSRFPSSRGLGHRPFTAKTRVRLPLGTPILIFFHFFKSAEWDLRIGSGSSPSSGAICV